MRVNSLIYLFVLCFFQIGCASMQNPDVNDGSSFEKAVIIIASGSFEGIQLEDDWLQKEYWGCKKISQGVNTKNGKTYDIITIVRRDGREKVIYFDITSFYGKF